jgi:hypothetical protein
MSVRADGILCRPDQVLSSLAMQRLRPLTEDECYIRCYGWIGEDDAVRVVRAGDDEPESVAIMTERIRLAFEAGLGETEREAA